MGSATFQPLYYPILYLLKIFRYQTSTKIFLITIYIWKQAWKPPLTHQSSSQSWNFDGRPSSLQNFEEKSSFSTNGPNTASIHYFDQKVYRGWAALEYPSIIMQQDPACLKLPTLRPPIHDPPFDKNNGLKQYLDH